MKISELCQVVNLSKDTIYFYIDSGLLYPSRKGSRYYFNEDDIEAVNRVAFYQEMGFTIKEIVEISSLWRWSNQMESSVIDTYKEMLIRRKRENDATLPRIQSAQMTIDEELRRFTESGEPNSRCDQAIGVPFSALETLICPDCGGAFKIIDAHMDMDYIFSGSIECRCGLAMRIAEGIIKTGNTYDGGYDAPDVDRKIYQNMPSDYYKSLNTIANRIQQEIDGCALSKPTILETNINGYSFMYNHLHLLKKNPLLIMIDRYPEVLHSYKEVMEQINSKPKIVYIADDALTYCIKEESVDYVISLFSANEHQLYKQVSYLEHISTYLKPGGVVLGAFMGFPRGSASRRNVMKAYPESSENAYLSDEFLYELNTYFRDTTVEELGAFEVLVDRMSFKHHVKGELMTHVFYKGTRK